MIGLVTMATQVKTQLKRLCCPMTVRLHFQVNYLEPAYRVFEKTLVNRHMSKGYYGQLLTAI